MIMATSTEYTVLRIDADSTTEEISKALSEMGLRGWKLAGSYHLHHLNSVDFVFSREAGATP